MILTVDAVSSDHSSGENVAPISFTNPSLFLAVSGSSRSPPPTSSIIQSSSTSGSAASRSTSSMSSPTLVTVSVGPSPNRLGPVLGFPGTVAEAFEALVILTGSGKLSGMAFFQRLKTPFVSVHAIRLSFGEKASCVMVEPGVPA